MATLKIPLVKDPVTGEDRVPPVIMKLLLDLGEHKKICPECVKAWETQSAIGMCLNGMLLYQELLEQPEVTIEQ